MESKLKFELERAKSLFYAWKLEEAYALFRRYYDRMAFRPEPEHVLYISYFFRCLLELGKSRELEFYLRRVEELYQTQGTDDLAYQLAEAYIIGPERNLVLAKALLTKVVEGGAVLTYVIKSKVLLAYCADMAGEPPSACRAILDTIGEIEDRQLALTVEIWRAKVLRDEGSFVEAETKLLGLLHKITVEGDWYSYFSAKVILAGLLVLKGEGDAAKELLAEIKQLAQGKSFKSILTQVAALEKRLSEKNQVVGVQLLKKLSHWELVYQDKSVAVKFRTAAAKVLVQLIRRRSLDKHALVKAVYQRAHEGSQDDKLVYYHIHGVRKLLATIGLPASVIENDGSGYRLIPEIEIIEGEL